LKKLEAGRAGKYIFETLLFQYSNTQLLTQLVIVLIALFSPALWIVFTQRYSFNGWLNPIVLCYATGIAMGNIPGFHIDKAITEAITQGTIIFAIPLLLVSNEFTRWIKYARAALTSLILCFIATLMAGAIGYFLFRHSLPNASKLAGMLVGVYAGGTANLFAVGNALNADAAQTVLLNTSDMICSSVYLLLLTSVWQKLLLLFLPPFKKHEDVQSVNYIDQEAFFRRLPLKPKLKSLLSVIAVGLVITAVSVGVSFLFRGKAEAALIILSLTTLSIAASFVKKINRHKSAYEAGNYLLLIFSVGMGMMANFKELMQSSGNILVFTAVVISSAVLLHLLFARIFKIDADTAIITSTATIFSPPFVGQVAGALKNKEMVPIGIVAGLIGIASGNYLGIGLAWLLQHFF